MYDFYFGELEEIIANEEKYLLFIKRLLPRWANGIPDSEYLAIFDILKQIDTKKKKPVLVETGSGASSLVLFYYAVKNDGILYTWDTNGSKGSFLRGVANDTVCKSFGVNLHKHWKFVSYPSTDPYLGIPILKEFDDKVDFCFLDSLHTLDNVLEELSLLMENFYQQAFVSIDDANYTNKSYNFDYVNMFRKKIGLNPVEEMPGNKCREYHKEVSELLNQRCRKVEVVDDIYKKTYSEDVFFNYYSTDKEVMGKMGMEKMKALEHRFDAWKIYF